MKIPNSFQGGLFRRHKQQYENGTLPKGFSRLYHFLPLTTDSTERVNQYMDQGFLKPIDIEEQEFGEGFHPSVLHRHLPEIEKTREAVLKVFKKITELSNSNLRRNFDALLSTISHRTEIL